MFNVPQGYASHLRSLRPCRTAFLNSLQDIQILPGILLNGSGR